jgi:hypothetical protein
MQYEIGKSYEMDEQPKVFFRGYHFYETIDDLYRWSHISPHDRICKIEAYGDIDKVYAMYCTNKIKILEEIRVTVAGINNPRNSNDTSTGRYNIGSYNTGNQNDGNRNTGDYNVGSFNSGGRNYGPGNTGFANDGYGNSGTMNKGAENTGTRNIGSANSGDMNKGDFNTGSYNTGNSNSGNHNIGISNSGDFNLGNNHSGVFNTESNPTIRFFDKESTWTYDDWLKSDACRILNTIPTTKADFVLMSDTTKNEREKYPSIEYIGGLLKIKEIGNEQRQRWWDFRLIDEEKQSIMSLPNFDAEKFYKCTGIRV